MLFLSENLKSLSILVKNQHRICAYKYNWAVAQTHRATEKRRFVFCNESSLSFFLLSDMLTIVSVIFSFENTSPVARYFQKKVILSPLDLVIFYSPINLRSKYHSAESRISLRNNITRRRRIELRDTPLGVSRQ